MQAFAKAFLVVVAMFIFLMYLWVDMEDHHDDYFPDDVVQLDSGCFDFDADDTVKMIFAHNRNWIEYFNNTNFCSQYDISYEAFDEAEFNRNNINIQYWIDDPDYWRQVYSKLYYDNKDLLGSLEDSLLRIKEARNLDRDAFATVVVAFVQDIPYEYVIPDECTGSEASPCNGNVAFGIYSPVEFLGRMHGDCDTRTVLLYTLLRNLGYQPLIINSHEYLHSMLALDVASSGDDFEYKGKRYAYWETTNVGWLAGMLPPDMNNKDYWSVALDYEF